MEFVATKTANKKHIRLRHAGEVAEESKNNGASQYARKMQTKQRCVWGKKARESKYVGQRVHIE